MKMGRVRTIAIHAFDGVTMFHLAAPSLVFGEVSRLALADGWQTVLWGDRPGTVTTAEGVMVPVRAPEPDGRGIDMLVIPSWPDSLPQPGDRLVELIRRVHASGVPLVGLCLGTFPLAAAGVLDGRSATTHWHRASQLAQRYPKVKVQPAALYIDHGDVLTSAGTAAALDACLHVVRVRLGSQAAATVARRIVVAPQRDGDQRQYVERPLPRDCDDASLSGTVQWALAHLDRRLTVQDLSGHANMSVRNFTRRFREHMGTSPAQWVASQRLDEARRLLETTTWPISRVAARCGFTSAVGFRQAFHRAFACSPSAYRARFTTMRRP